MVIFIVYIFLVFNLVTYLKNNKTTILFVLLSKNYFTNENKFKQNILLLKNNFLIFISIDRKLYQKENPYAPAMYNSFLKQLMNDVCSPMRPNLPILKTRADGFTDLIKIGFK